MDLGTLIGGLLGAGLVLGAILLSGNLMAFVDIPSILIVVGGSIACTMTAFKLKNCASAFKVALNAVFDRTPSIQETTDKIQELAEKVRKDSLLALEGETVANAFMEKAIRLAVDGVPVDTIRDTLGRELSSMQSRHLNGQKVFRFLAGIAPGMGMIGTLIGLVQMLQTLSDPSAIGPAMAVALLTTFYGGIIAFMICGPIADKLEARTAEEASNMKAIIEGIDCIVKGENKLVIKEKLDAFLAPMQRKAN